MKSFKEFQESVAQEVGGKGLTGAVVRGVANVAAGPLKKAVKVSNVFRSNKGKDILQGLFGTPDKPKDTDWDKNPKDEIDRELNVKQRQAKDKEKFKSFDKKVKAARKARKAGNLSDEQYKDLLKDAGKDSPDNVVPMRKPKPKNPKK